MVEAVHDQTTGDRHLGNLLPLSSDFCHINAFVLNFGGKEATGIVDTDFKSASQESGISNPLQQTWYTIDGRRLNGKPTSKGIYINNGRKIVIH